MATADSPTKVRGARRTWRVLEDEGREQVHGQVDADGAHEERVEEVAHVVAQARVLAVEDGRARHVPRVGGHVAHLGRGQAAGHLEDPAVVGGRQRPR